MQQSNSDKNQNEASGTQAEDALIGAVIDEKFQLLSLLGYGASSRVYKARHRLTEQEVAIKLLSSRLLDSEKAIKRFKNEASLLGALNHQNLVKFYSYGITANGSPYLVTEFLAGKTLEQLLRDEGAQTAERTLPIFLDICRGLAYAHSKGVVHRDIKPGNILVIQVDDGIESAKILDFGVYKRLDSKDQKLTETGVLIGSANYMSPELCSNARVDARTDIYSLGCLMYECLVGVPPMPGENEMAIMLNQLSRKLTAVPARHGISADLQDIILKCLDKAPSARFQDAEELGKALAATSLQKERLNVFKLPAQAWIAIAALVLTGIAAMGIASQLKSARTAAQEQYKGLRAKPKPVLLREGKDDYKLKDLENWITANMEDDRHVPELANAWCEAQLRHYENSIPGNTRDVAIILEKLEKYLKSQRVKADYREQLRTLFSTAKVQILAGKTNEFWETIKKLESPRFAKDSDQKNERDARLGNELWLCERIARVMGENRQALKLNEHIARIMSERQDLQQLENVQTEQARVSTLLAELPQAKTYSGQALITIDQCCARGEQENPLPYIKILGDLPSLDILEKAKQIRTLFEKYFPQGIVVAGKTGSQNASLRFSGNPMLASEDIYIRSRVELARVCRLSGDRIQAQRTLDKELQERAIKLSFRSGGKFIPENLFVFEICQLKPAHLSEVLRLHLSQAKKLSSDQYLRSALIVLSILPESNPDKSAILSETISALAALEKSEPESCARVHMLSGQIYSNQAEHSAAKAEFEKGLSDLKGLKEMGGWEYLGRKGLICSLVALKDYKQALKLIDELCTSKDFERLPASYAFTYLALRGQVLFASGQEIEGLKVQEALFQDYKVCNINALEYYADFCDKLADNYESQGSAERAIEVLKSAASSLLKYNQSDTKTAIKLLQHLKRLCLKFQKPDLLRWCKATETAETDLKQLLQEY